jgi:putative membrane protein
MLLAVPVTAFAQTNDASTTQTSAVSRKTQDFVTQAAVSDLFEIASSKLALAHGNEAEKQFANQMIADHSKTSSELKRIVLTGLPKTEIPSQMDAAHQRKLDQLNAARGTEFEALYAAQQLEAHKDAVSLFDQYASSGDHADLKTWAGATLPALKHHLEMAQQGAQQKSPTVGSSTVK